MAASLLDAPLAKKLLAIATREGVDLETALNGDDAALKPTEIAQPALFLVETVLAANLPKGLEVLGTAGHSVGEYAAVVAAGVATAEQGMELVIRRGKAMAAMRQGTMAAILGIDAPVAEEICRAVAVDDDTTVVVANLNAPGQVVISGTAAGVEQASAMARERGAKRVVPLAVSGAFHSPLMADAAEAFAADIAAAKFKDTKTPVIANVDGTASLRAEDVRQRLRRQLVSPVRWTDCVARLAGLGCDVFVELGPGSVLTGLAKRIAPGVDGASASTLEELQALPDLLGARAR